ncbi:MAG: ATP-binding protein [Parvibaculaceae bacterium]
MNQLMSFGVIAASLTDGVISIDRTGEILAVNHAVEEIFGYSEQDLLGRNVSILMPQEMGSEHSSYLAASTVGQVGKPLTLNKVLPGRRKDGAIIPVNVTVFRLQGEDGEPYFLGLINDRSTGEALKEEQQKTRLLYRNIDLLKGIGMWRLDIRTGLLEWTDQVYDIHGLDKETFDLTVENAIARFHPDDRDRVSDTLTEAVVTGESFELRGRLVRPDGSIRFIKSVGHSDSNNTGTPVSIFGTFVDLTAEQERENELARFSAQQVMLKDILYLCSGTDDPRAFCEQALTCLARFKWTSFRNSIALFLANRTRERHYCAASIGFSDEETHNLSLRCNESPKGFEEEDNCLFPISSKDETLGYLAFVRVTDRPIAPQEQHFLSALVDVLAISLQNMRQQTMIAERNAALNARVTKVEQLNARFAQQAKSLARLSEELERQKQRAEMANNSKSAFLANMSHEARTPLNGVLGMLSMLELAPLRPEEKECVELAKQATYSARQLIDDILDLSRLEAGKLSIEPKEFPLSDMLTRISMMLEPKARAKELTFEIENRLGACTVTGDELRTQQILINLGDNAIKFTKTGSVRLLLEPGTEPNTIAFTVTDTGVGIPEEKCESMFERFEQADPSSTRTYGGAGLGLSISKNLIDLMGGTIGVTSKPGKGSSFRVELPLPAVKAGGPLEEAEAEAFHVPCRSLRILAAEDNAMNQEILKRLAKALHLDMTIVENGTSAVEAVATGSFDIVLMDIQMPGMDGTEATRAIRAAGSDIPIIAVTAHAMSGDMERFKADGFNGYVSKPYEIGTLLNEIEKVTEGATKALDTSAAAHAGPEYASQG